MRVITIRSQIREVAAEWNANLSDTLDKQYNAKRRAIGKQLAELDVETATAADVGAIIGNDSWLVPECDECGQMCDAVVQYGVGNQEGEEYEYDHHLCRRCIEKALDAMIEEATP